MPDEYEQPYKYVQTIVSIDEFKEIEAHLKRKGIKNRREWIKETLLKEVRKPDDKPLQLH